METSDVANSERRAGKSWWNTRPQVKSKLYWRINSESSQGNFVLTCSTHLTHNWFNLSSADVGRSSGAISQIRFYANVMKTRFVEAVGKSNISRELFFPASTFGYKAQGRLSQEWQKTKTRKGAKWE